MVIVEIVVAAWVGLNILALAAGVAVHLITRKASKASNKQLPEIITDLAD